MARVTAQGLRAESTPEIAIGPDRTIQVRRISLPELLFVGYIPLPLMQAVEALEQADITSPATLFARPPEERAAILELAERWICAASVDPVFVMADDGDPAHAPVSTLLFEEKMAAFSELKALADRPAPATEAPVSLPRITEAAAQEFRGTEPGAPAPAVPAGEDVSPTAEHVGAADVEYVGC